MKKYFWKCQIRENTFLDRGVGPYEDDLVQNVWLQYTLVKWHPG